MSDGSVDSGSSSNTSVRAIPKHDESFRLRLINLDRKLLPCYKKSKEWMLPITMLQQIYFAHLKLSQMERIVKKCTGKDLVLMKESQISKMQQWIKEKAYKSKESFPVLTFHEYSSNVEDIRDNFNRIVINCKDASLSRKEKDYHYNIKSEVRPCRDKPRESPVKTKHQRSHSPNKNNREFSEADAKRISPETHVVNVKKCDKDSDEGRGKSLKTKNKSKQNLSTNKEDHLSKTHGEKMNRNYQKLPERSEEIFVKARPESDAQHEPKISEKSEAVSRKEKEENKKQTLRKVSEKSEATDSTKYSAKSKTDHAYYNGTSPRHDRTSPDESRDREQNIGQKATKKSDAKKNAAKSDLYSTCVNTTLLSRKRALSGESQNGEAIDTKSGTSSAITSPKRKQFRPEVEIDDPSEALAKPGRIDVALPTSGISIAKVFSADTASQCARTKTSASLPVFITADGNAVLNSMTTSLKPVYPNQAYQPYGIMFPMNVANIPFVQSCFYLPMTPHNARVSTLPPEFSKNTENPIPKQSSVNVDLNLNNNNTASCFSHVLDELQERSCSPDDADFSSTDDEGSKKVVEKSEERNCGDKRYVEISTPNQKWKSQNFINRAKWFQKPGFENYHRNTDYVKSSFTKQYVTNRNLSTRKRVRNGFDEQAASSTFPVKFEKQSLNGAPNFDASRCSTMKDQYSYFQKPSLHTDPYEQRAGQMHQTFYSEREGQPLNLKNPSSPKPVFIKSRKPLNVSSKPATANVRMRYNDSYRSKSVQKARSYFHKPNRNLHYVKHGSSYQHPRSSPAKLENLDSGQDVPSPSFIQATPTRRYLLRTSDKISNSSAPKLAGHKELVRRVKPSNHADVAAQKLLVENEASIAELIRYIRQSQMERTAALSNISNASVLRNTNDTSCITTESIKKPSDSLLPTPLSKRKKKRKKKSAKKNSLQQVVNDQKLKAVNKSASVAIEKDHSSSFVNLANEFVTLDEDWDAVADSDKKSMVSPKDSKLSGEQDGVINEDGSQVKTLPGQDKKQNKSKADLKLNSPAKVLNGKKKPTKNLNSRKSQWPFSAVIEKVNNAQLQITSDDLKNENDYRLNKPITLHRPCFTGNDNNWHGVFADFDLKFDLPASSSNSACNSDVISTQVKTAYPRQWKKKLIEKVEKHAGNDSSTSLNNSRKLSPDLTRNVVSTVLLEMLDVIDSNEINRITDKLTKNSQPCKNAEQEEVADLQHLTALPNEPGFCQMAAVKANTSTLIDHDLSAPNNRHGDDVSTDKENTRKKNLLRKVDFYRGSLRKNNFYGNARFYVMHTSDQSNTNLVGDAGSRLVPPMNNESESVSNKLEKNESYVSFDTNSVHIDKNIGDINYHISEDDNASTDVPDECDDKSSNESDFDERIPLRTYAKIPLWNDKQLLKAWNVDNCTVNIENMMLDKSLKAIDQNGTDQIENNSSLKSISETESVDLCSSKLTLSFDLKESTVNTCKHPKARKSIYRPKNNAISDQTNEMTVNGENDYSCSQSSKVLKPGQTNEERVTNHSRNPSKMNVHELSDCQNLVPDRDKKIITSNRTRQHCDVVGSGHKGKKLTVSSRLFRQRTELPSVSSSDDDELPCSVEEKVNVTTKSDDKQESHSDDDILLVSCKPFLSKKQQEKKETQAGITTTQTLNTDLKLVDNKKTGKQVKRNKARKRITQPTANKTDVLTSRALLTDAKGLALPTNPVTSSKNDHLEDQTAMRISDEKSSESRDGGNKKQTSGSDGNSLRINGTSKRAGCLIASNLSAVGKSTSTNDGKRTENKLYHAEVEFTTSTGESKEKINSASLIALNVGKCAGDPFTNSSGTETLKSAAGLNVPHINGENVRQKRHTVDEACSVTSVDTPLVTSVVSLSKPSNDCSNALPDSNSSVLHSTESSVMQINSATSVIKLSPQSVSNSARQAEKMIPDNEQVLSSSPKSVFGETYHHGMLEINLSAPSSCLQLGNKFQGQVVSHCIMAFLRRRIPYIQLRINPTVTKNLTSGHAKQLHGITEPLTGAECGTVLIRMRDAAFSLKIDCSSLLQQIVDFQIRCYIPNEYTQSVYELIYNSVARKENKIFSLLGFSRPTSKAALNEDSMMHLNDYLKIILPNFYVKTFRIFKDDLPNFVSVTTYKPIDVVTPLVIQTFSQSYLFNQTLIENDILVKTLDQTTETPTLPANTEVTTINRKRKSSQLSRNLLAKTPKFPRSRKTNKQKRTTGIQHQTVVAFDSSANVLENSELLLKCSQAGINPRIETESPVTVCGTNPSCSQTDQIHLLPNSVIHVPNKMDKSQEMRMLSTSQSSPVCVASSVAVREIGEEMRCNSTPSAGPQTSAIVLPTLSDKCRSIQPSRILSSQEATGLTIGAKFINDNLSGSPASPQSFHEFQHLFESLKQRNSLSLPISGENLSNNNNNSNGRRQNDFPKVLSPLSFAGNRFNSVARYGQTTTGSSVFASKAMLPTLSAEVISTKRPLTKLVWHDTPYSLKQRRARPARSKLTETTFDKSCENEQRDVQTANL